MSEHPVQDQRIFIEHVNLATLLQWASATTPPDRDKLMVLHFIDEASKMPHGKIIREGRVNNYSDLGNCDAPDLIAAIVEWTRHMDHPSCFPVDAEGFFHSG